MRLAVTGAAGFIGHRIVEALLARGDDVVAIDDLSTGDPRRMERVCGDVRFCLLDVRDTAGLVGALARCEAVLHQAGRTSATRGTSPRELMSVNASGTASVVMAAARAGVRRVILASSAAVYGHGRVFPLSEREGPAPCSAYGRSKAAAESALRGLGARWGLETTTLRYFNVYGPGQGLGSGAVLPAWMARAFGASSPIVHGDGSTTRDFTFVDDVVAANLRAASADHADGAVLNIGSGVERSLRDVLEELGAVLGRDLRPVYAPRRAGDPSRSVADVSRSRELLGHAAEVSFRVGLERTVAWHSDVSRLPRRRPERVGCRTMPRDARAAATRLEAARA